MTRHAVKHCSMTDDLREQWDANALAFTELIGDRGTPHHRAILNPCVEELMGDVKGKTLLDAGCGEGYLSRYYAKRGATTTGVDISPRLIERAEALTDSSLGVTYEVGDICNLEQVDDAQFDQILCNLVLLNVPCLTEALSEFQRVLRSGGILVFSIVHPAFNFYGPGSWEMGEKNPSTGRREGLFFRVDKYTDEKECRRYWRTREGEKFPEPFSFYHRTISTYIRAILDAGLRIVAVEEPLPSDESEFFDRERRVPFFMVFKAVKD